MQHAGVLRCGQLFAIRQKVTKEIEGNLMAALCSRSDLNHIFVKLKWDPICSPKEEVWALRTLGNGTKLPVEASMGPY